jgi:hypothetical protein
MASLEVIIDCTVLDQSDSDRRDAQLDEILVSLGGDIAAEGLENIIPTPLYCNGTYCGVARFVKT